MLLRQLRSGDLLRQEVPGAKQAPKYALDLLFDDEEDALTLNRSLLLYKGMAWWRYRDHLITTVGDITRGDDRRNVHRDDKKCTAKMDHVKAVCEVAFLPKDEHYQELLIRHRKGEEVSRKAKATSPVLVGHTNQGPVETGLCLHPLWGFPIIPGSALKGLALSALLWKSGLLKEAIDKGVDRADVDPRKPGSLCPASGDCFFQKYKEAFGTWRDLFGMAPTKGLTPKGLKDLASEGTEGGVIFYDAWPSDPSKCLRADVWTVHYPKYYQDKEPWPGDDENPNPLPQIAVKKGTTFEFTVAPSPRAKQGEELCDCALDYLMWGLENLGIGAKTSSGYGYFKPGDKRRIP